MFARRRRSRYAAYMRSRRSGLIFLMSLGVAGCAPIEPLPPPPPPPDSPVVYEKDLPPAERARVEIIDLQEIPEPESKRVRVNGTLVNFGKASTSQVSVKVRAVDANGQVVNMIYGVPSTQYIPPGGSATFTAWFDDRPDVRRYHVEAVVR
jgi:hypothetical protein